MKLSENELHQITNIDKMSADFYLLNLGIGLQYEYSSSNVKYSAPYLEMGKELWESFRYELYDIICDNDSNQPKEFLKDIISGDIRNLATGIISVITAKYNVTLAIAVPVTALIIKNGVMSFCSKKPQRSRKAVKEILDAKKDSFHIETNKRKLKDKK